MLSNLAKVCIAAGMGDCTSSTQSLLRSYMLGKLLTGGLVAHTPRLADGAYGTARCRENIAVPLRCVLKQNGAKLELPLDISMFGKTEFQLRTAALGRTLRPSVEAKYVDQCCAPGFEGGGCR